MADSSAASLPSLTSSGSLLAVAPPPLGYYMASSSTMHYYPPVPSPFNHCQATNNTPITNSHSDPATEPRSNGNNQAAPSMPPLQRSYNVPGYRDYADAHIDHGQESLSSLLMATPFQLANRCKSSDLVFPQKLHMLLTASEQDAELARIVSWRVHGRAFTVQDRKRFVKEVLPEWFLQSRFESFQRQLNLYGFKRITTGPDRGACYHELCLRQKPLLAGRIQRIRLKGKGPRKPAAPELEPNFYRMRLLPTHAMMVKSQTAVSPAAVAGYTPSSTSAFPGAAGAITSSHGQTTSFPPIIPRPSAACSASAAAAAASDSGSNDATFSQPQNKDGQAATIKKAAPASANTANQHGLCALMVRPLTQKYPVLAPRYNSLPSESSSVSSATGVGNGGAGGSAVLVSQPASPSIHPLISNSGMSLTLSPVESSPPVQLPADTATAPPMFPEIWGNRHSQFCLSTEKHQESTAAIMNMTNPAGLAPRRVSQGNFDGQQERRGEEQNAAKAAFDASFAFGGDFSRSFSAKQESSTYARVSVVSLTDANMDSNTSMEPAPLEENEFGDTDFALILSDLAGGRFPSSH